MNGQKDAFAQLVHRYQHRIYTMSLIRMKDRYEADDLAQETFIQAYRKLSAYDPERSFRNWLFSICANLGKNRLRSRSRRREVHNPHPEHATITLHDQDHARIDLRAALYRIPEKRRIPLVLKHVEGLSYNEISAVMNIGTSAAKMRVKRGRDELVRNLSAPEAGSASKNVESGKQDI